MDWRRQQDDAARSMALSCAGRQLSGFSDKRSSEQPAIPCPKLAIADMVADMPESTQLTDGVEKMGFSSGFMLLEQFLPGLRLGGC